MQLHQQTEMCRGKLVFDKGLALLGVLVFGVAWNARAADSRLMPGPLPQAAASQPAPAPVAPVAQDADSRPKPAPVPQAAASQPAPVAPVVQVAQGTASRPTPAPVPQVAASQPAPAPVAPVAQRTVARPTPAPAPQVAASQPAPAPVAPVAQGTASRLTPKPVPVAGGQTLSVPVAPRATGEQGGVTLVFASVTLAGPDAAVVAKLPEWPAILEELKSGKLTQDGLALCRKKIELALQAKGYVFAKVELTAKEADQVEVKADCAQLRNVTVTGNKHYSTRQIEQKVRQGNAGGRFNYAKIYNNLYDLNSKPDLKMDSKFAPKDEAAGRYVDVNLSVRDSLPIHGAFEIANTGVKNTDDWRMRTSLEHDNLTKHNDVLSVSWLTSPDLHEVNAYSASYSLPIDDKWNLSLFGGWSDSAVKDVLPMLDINGNGYFAGIQLERVVFENDMHRVGVAVGWLYENMESTPAISGLVLPTTETTSSMPTLSVNYMTKQLDAWNGRTFVNNTIMANWAGKLGSSSMDSFTSNGASNAAGDFVIDQFQIARLQRLFSGDEERPGKFLLFARIGGQVSSESLVGTLRQGIGGMYTVRGYPEQEVAGDNTFMASVELRTPLMQNCVPGMKKDAEFLQKNPEYWGRHKLDAFVFADFGYSEIKAPMAGETEYAKETLISVGPGLSMQLTKYSLIKLAWGIPLNSTDDSESGGRVHLSIQLQF